MITLNVRDHHGIEHEGKHKGMERQPEGGPELRLHDQHRLCSIRKPPGLELPARFSVPEDKHWITWKLEVCHRSDPLWG